jgi:hypothetical protein
MRRRILIALFALGAIGGYGSALMGASCHAHARRAAWEQHVAKVCVEAAKRAPAAAADAP